MTNHILRLWEVDKSIAERRENTLLLTLEEFQEFATQSLRIYRLDEFGDCWIMDGYKLKWERARKELAELIGEVPAESFLHNYAHRFMYLPGYGRTHFRCQKNRACLRPSHMGIQKSRWEKMP